MRRRKDDSKANKAIKYRIYPTDEQKVMFAKTFGCCRKMWNLLRDEAIENHKIIGKYTFSTPAAYKDEYPYLREVDSLALVNVQIHLHEAFEAYFDKDRKNDFPCRKTRRKSKASYTTNNQKGTVSITDDGCIKLPKYGNVKAVMHRLPKDGWKIKSATVSMDKDHKYYISVLFEYEASIISVSLDTNTIESRTLGLDYASNGLYVDSNGDSADMPKYYRSAQKRRTRAQKKQARRIRSHIIGYNGKKPVYDTYLSECKNIQKENVRIAKLEKKVANQRKDFLHKKSTAIAKQYDFVCVEDINMTSLSNKGFGNGKATMDNGFGMFRTMLAYKLFDKGGKLVLVDKWFPSSQLCNCCGYKNPAIKDLKVREWDCPVCGTHHDRDINAAINIKNEGIRILLTA